jgi:hypothetical protein
MAVHEFNKLMPQASPYSPLDWYEFKKLNRSIFSRYVSNVVQKN